MTSDAGVGLELTVGAAHEVEHVIRAELCTVIDARESNGAEDTDAPTDLALEDAVDAQSHGARAYVRDGPIHDRLCPGGVLRRRSGCSARRCRGRGEDEQPDRYGNDCDQAPHLL